MEIRARCPHLPGLYMETFREDSEGALEIPNVRSAAFGTTWYWAADLQPNPMHFYSEVSHGLLPGRCGKVRIADLVSSKAPGLTCGDIRLTSVPPSGALVGYATETRISPYLF